MKVLLVGDYPPPYGGVSVHVEVVQKAVRAHGGVCDVLDVGKGQLPADGVVPATGYFATAAHLVRYAMRGFRIHVHTSGANPKSWMLATACAAAGKLSARPPIITFHSGLGPEWLSADPVRAKIACAVTNCFGNVIAVSDEIRATLISCGVSRERIEVLPAFSRSFLEPGALPHGLSEIRAEAAPLYCAMLAPGAVYGHETLLRAFAAVHSASISSSGRTGPADERAAPSRSACGIREMTFSPAMSRLASVSTTLQSSRTFPGQSYSSKLAATADDNRMGGRRMRSAYSASWRLAMRRMSPLRSRSGGRRRWTTRSRW